MPTSPTSWTHLALGCTEPRAQQGEYKDDDDDIDDDNDNDNDDHIDIDDDYT